MGDIVSYVVMGVSGSGKSTIGKRWAEYRNIPFLDADDFHPPANIKKMQEGIPLTDTDRWPWLEVLSDEIAKQPQGCVLACSALKDTYREILSCENNLVFILLNASRETLLTRMHQRQDHFMPASLLDSQLATLEIPEEATVVDVSLSVDEILETLKERL